MKECERCKGSGIILERHHQSICPDCQGRGIYKFAFDFRGNYQSVLAKERMRICKPKRTPMNLGPRSGSLKKSCFDTHRHQPHGLMSKLHQYHCFSSVTFSRLFDIYLLLLLTLIHDLSFLIPRLTWLITSLLVCKKG
jgi:hypothetical protein